MMEQMVAGNLLWRLTGPFAGYQAISDLVSYHASLNVSKGLESVAV